MNNSIKIFFLIISVTLLSSCCTNVSKDKSNLSNLKKVTKNPTAISINKSIVTAKVEEIVSVENEIESFIVKASIIKVEEDPAYPSMAMVNEIYELIPSFQLDDKQRINADSEKNKRLNLLSKIKPGSEFRAEIFFEQSKGWFIQDVL